MRIAVDTGGTFTDFVYSDGDSVGLLKVPSTPSAPHQAVAEGLRRIGLPDELLVGTTLVTNCLLQRSAPQIALLTTEGFEDVLEIGRQRRDELYSLYPKRAEPLVGRQFRFGIKERVGADGSVVIPLDEESVRKVASRLKRHRIKRAAVVLLFSFLNAQHERRVAEILTEHDIESVCSSDVAPEFREFERTSTTVISAYAEPVFRDFNREVSRLCPSVRFMLSSGGFAPAEALKNRSVYTVLSGPVAGCAGARAWARRSGIERLITLDMGGTSTDVCAIRGELPFKKGVTVAGLYAHIVSASVETIGAGGGSKVWVDEGGALRVGPESAGAEPGPAAYGRGGPPTLTDALLLLGRLPESLPSGLVLRRELSERALGTLASRLGLHPSDLATSVVDIAVAATAGAVRKVTVRKGEDPQKFSLFVFGGAGPLVGAEVAEALLIDRIVVPPEPGVFSSFGLLCSPMALEESVSVHRLLGRMDRDELESLRTRLKGLLRSRLTSKVRYRYFAELRYPEQSYELRIPASGSPHLLAKRFHTAHRRLYGYAFEGREVEMTVLRARAESPSTVPNAPSPETDFELDTNETETVWKGRRLITPLLKRSDFEDSEGPLIICDYSATTFVPPGWRVRRDDAGNLIMERR